MSLTDVMLQYQSVEMIGDINITVHEKSQPSTISYLRTFESYNWCSELNLSDQSRTYGAVIANDDSLVNIDDYVAFLDDEYSKVHANHRIITVHALYCVTLFSHNMAILKLLLKSTLFNTVWCSYSIEWR